MPDTSEPCDSEGPGSRPAGRNRSTQARPASAPEPPGWTYLFLDQDLRDGLVVGEEWEQRLHERLRWADAVVCLLTSAYLASVWCTAELTIAQTRGSRLLPVRAEPGVNHPLLKAVQRADAATDICVARVQLAEALRRLDDAGGSGWADDRPPWPGLRPFDTDLHRVFLTDGACSSLTGRPFPCRPAAVGTAYRCRVGAGDQGQPSVGYQ
jgi:hypothetical protein